MGKGGGSPQYRGRRRKPRAATPRLCRRFCRHRRHRASTPSPLSPYPCPRPVAELARPPLGIIGRNPAKKLGSTRLPDQTARRGKKVSHQRPSLERTKGKVFPPARACERTHLPHRHPSDRCNPVPGAPSYCFHLDSITSRQVVLDCTAHNQNHQSDDTQPSYPPILSFPQLQFAPYLPRSFQLHFRPERMTEISVNGHDDTNEKDENGQEMTKESLGALRPSHSHHTHAPPPPWFAGRNLFH